MLKQCKLKEIFNLLESKYNKEEWEEFFSETLGFLVLDYIEKVSP